MLRKHLHEENRAAWNVATEAHNSHKADQAKFLCEGGSTLFPDELELLGTIAGKSLVHLQCNSGQDTLSLAKLGARVTGVDISDTAIDFARRLSTDTNIPATFYRADVYDWLQQTQERFDIAFSSYGALVWLSDIRLWAKRVASILVPGGKLAVLEFHPLLNSLADDWELKYDYFKEGRTSSFDSGIGDYVAMSRDALAPSGYLEGVENFTNPHPGHEFNWTVSDVITALIDAGLHLTTFREYPYMNAARLLNNMREMPGHRMVPPERMPSLPLMFGFAAEKSS
ncbi:MAG: class I SAM-dependent methyltransferase [Chloroflexota bacterium]